MPYTNLRMNKAGLAMINTLRKNFESYKKMKLKKLSCLATYRA